ncbi:hypothetical protein FKW77_002305 [Venturia effusa]|uniref:Pentatricopeptide repeat domain-containing protein n=1 Tax=Venturia effusa TaxID=50376 RepID=A0A517L0Z0_9PEZI|nr:hypothetical protein FKW77_002305 [Venturia effusa]
MQAALVWLNARPANCQRTARVHDLTSAKAFSTGYAFRTRRAIPEWQREQNSPQETDEPEAPLLNSTTDPLVKGPLYVERLPATRDNGTTKPSRTERVDQGKRTSRFVRKSELYNLARHDRPQLKGPRYSKQSDDDSKWTRTLPAEPTRSWKGTRHVLGIGSLDDSTEELDAKDDAGTEYTRPSIAESFRPSKAEASFLPRLLPGEPGAVEAIEGGSVRKVPLDTKPLVRTYLSTSAIEPIKPRAGMMAKFMMDTNGELPHQRASTEVGIWKDGHDYGARLRVQGYNYKQNEDSEEIVELLSLLQSMARTLEKEGIAIAWRQFRQKKHVHVPTTGPAALNIWKIFLMNPELHADIFEYALEVRNVKGDVYEPLYEHIVGHELAQASEDAFAWHKKFKKAYTIPRHALRSLIGSATTSDRSLAIFLKLYIDNWRNSDPIYDIVVPRLVSRRRYQDAMTWHTTLFTRGDLPSPTVTDSPMMDRFHRFRNSLVATSLKDHLTPPKTSVTESGATIRHVDGSLAFNRQTVYSILGEKHGIAPKTFSDEFCARLFATKAFSTALVINSLRMLGIQAIGPLALREMVVRDAETAIIKQKIVDLRTAGISLGNSVFSRAVAKFVEDGRDDLLRSLLDSDQHPDVLEDSPLQRKLLASYLAHDDWDSVHRTLMILTLFHEDPNQESWNLLLRHYLRSKSTDSRVEAETHAWRKRRKIQQVIFEMTMAKVLFTAETVQCMLSQLLAPRRSGQRPVSRPKTGTSLDDLNLVTNLFFQISNTGQTLPARCWRELIRRYGMTGRFSSMVHLCVRLTKLYSPPSRLRALLPSPSSSTATQRDPILADHDIDPELASTLHAKHPAHPSRQLFNAAAVQAIVSWGFQLGSHLLHDHTERRRHSQHVMTKRNAPWPSHITPPPTDATFLRGVRFVEELRQKGAHVDTGVVRKVIKQRLWQLFSPTISWRNLNRRAQILNPYSLEKCLRGVLDIWKGPSLFPKKLLLIKSKEDRTKWHREHTKKPTNSNLPAVSEDFPSFDLETDALMSEEHKLKEDPVPKHHPGFTGDHYMTMHAILSKLDSNPNLPLPQRISYRRTIVRALFGPDPMLGHRRRTDAKRVDAEEWDKVVTQWAARGGGGRFRMRVGGLARTAKGELAIVRKKRVLREGMVKRRNRVVVSGRGSRALHYFKDAWGEGDGKVRDEGSEH